MFWIILTGILSCGLIPLLAAIGFGIELIVNIFTTVSWGYWQNVAVGLIVLIVPSVKLFNFSFKRKTKKEPKADNKIEQKIFNYFKIEKTDKEKWILGDFADKDFRDWLRFIHGIIQNAMNKKTFDGIQVENYVNITLYIGGQRVDIALVKDGKKSPHELLQDKKI